MLHTVKNRDFRHAVVATVAFASSFVIGVVAGAVLCRGQDPAGSGIGLALGLIVVGAGGGLLTGLYSCHRWRRYRRHPAAWSPLVIWVLVYGVLSFTRLGDRGFEALQRAVCG